MQLIEFSPVEPLLALEEKARRRIYTTVGNVDAYLRARVDTEAMNREVDIVSGPAV